MVFNIFSWYGNFLMSHSFKRIVSQKWITIKSLVKLKLCQCLKGQPFMRKGVQSRQQLTYMVWTICCGNLLREQRHSMAVLVMVFLCVANVQRLWIFKIKGAIIRLLLLFQFQQDIYQHLVHLGVGLLTFCSSICMLTRIHFYHTPQALFSF